MTTGVVCILAAIIMSWIVKKYRYSEITISFALDVLIQILHIFTFIFLSCMLLLNELFFFRFLSFYCFHKTCECLIELSDDILYFWAFMMMKMITMMRTKVKVEEISRELTKQDFVSSFSKIYFLNGTLLFLVYVLI